MQRVRTGSVIFALVATTLFGLVESVAAHHSQAMYDANQRLTLTGSVKSFAWENPHIRLQLLVHDEHGALVEWDLEGGAVPQLRRRGWGRNSLKPGETVTVVIHPLRSGAPGGVVTKVTRANGEVIGAAPPANGPQR